jgi:hypothetical protein
LGGATLGGAASGAIGGAAGGALFGGLPTRSRGGSSDSTAPSSDSSAPSNDSAAPSDDSAAPSDDNSSGSGGGCPASESFTAATRVVMADGTTKAIKDVKRGDTVLADHTTSGANTTEPVIATNIHTDTDLADLTVKQADGRTAVVHTTSKHPYWSDTRHAWILAGQLAVGEHLHAADGSSVTVVSVKQWTQAHAMYDLTVNELHDFYVMAGATPVLVHNCTVDYFDPDNDLVNAVHNQRIADKNNGNLYAAARYRDANGDVRIGVAHSNVAGHAEQHLISTYGKGNIIDLYSEFQPCSGRIDCWTLTDGINRSWTWPWTVSGSQEATDSQAARKAAMAILFELARK